MDLVLSLSDFFSSIAARAREYHPSSAGAEHARELVDALDALEPLHGFEHFTRSRAADAFRSVAHELALETELVERPFRVARRHVLEIDCFGAVLRRHPELRRTPARVKSRVVFVSAHLRTRSKREDFR